MKGLVFTEFLDMVDSRFSMETCEKVIGLSHLPSGGAYTSVGTYDFGEMVSLVSNLSHLTGRPVAELLGQFGRHLFGRFLELFPSFFEGVTSPFNFLPSVDQYVHVEVRKLYPDAELPSFACESHGPGRLTMIYRSNRNLPDLAEGLIRACIDHYGKPVDLVRSAIPGDVPATAFHLTARD